MVCDRDDGDSDNGNCDDGDRDNGDHRHQLGVFKQSYKKSEPEHTYSYPTSTYKQAAINILIQG